MISTRVVLFRAYKFNNVGLGLNIVDYRYFCLVNKSQSKK